MLSKTDKDTISKHFAIPAYINACASAVYYDLMHGPSWSRIPQGDVTKFTADDYATYRDDLEDEKRPGDLIEETYVGQVGKTLRAYLNELPSIWYDAFDGNVLTSEPQGYEDDETGEYIEPDYSEIYELESRDLIEVLFGKTIAREFY